MHAPGFTWPRGTEARWSRDGVVGGQPPPTQCQPAGATGYAGSCWGEAWLSPGREAGGGTEHPRCLQLPALCPPAAPGSPVPCLDWCSRTPALGELGPSVTQDSEGDRKGAKPPCPLGHPGAGSSRSCPARRGCPLRTGVQWGQTTPVWGGGPARRLVAAAPGAPQGSGARAPAGTPARLPGGRQGPPAAPAALRH